jgi:hypothetical protein
MANLRHSAQVSPMNHSHLTALLASAFFASALSSPAQQPIAVGKGSNASAPPAGLIILNPAMGGADVAQRRRDAKRCALVHTHPAGECLLVCICFFFASLRDIPSPDLG